MESSRDSGWRHDAGRLVQFCACRKPTITICRVMFDLQTNSTSSWGARRRRASRRMAASSDSFQIQLRGQTVFGGEAAQLVPGRVLDIDAVLGALLRALVLHLAGIEHARAP